jgi:hypothetical protein
MGAISFGAWRFKVALTAFAPFRPQRAGDTENSSYFKICSA